MIKKTLLWIVCLSLFLGCSPKERNYFHSEKYAFSFKFPDGWKRLTRAELEKKFTETGPGHNKEVKRILTIGDPHHEALFYVLEIVLEPGHILNLPPETLEKLAVLFDHQFSKELPGYKTIHLGRANLDGREGGEIVFQKTGRTVDEAWHQHMYFTSGGHLLCLGLATPLEGKGIYKKDFQTIMITFRWQDKDY